MNKIKGLLAISAFSLLILGLPAIASAQWNGGGTAATETADTVIVISVVGEAPQEPAEGLKCCGPLHE